MEPLDLGSQEFDLGAQQGRFKLGDAAFDPCAVSPLILPLTSCVMAGRFAREFVDSGAERFKVHVISKCQVRRADEDCRFLDLTGLR
jgi:hypothetical protein